MSLCCALKLFVEAWDQLGDVLSDSHGGHSEQRAFDVLPQLECLLAAIHAVARECSKMAISRRIDGVPFGCRTQHRRQKHTAGNSPSEEQVRSGAKLLAPISGGVDFLFQFLEIGAESSPGLVDMRLYFVGCFIHPRFSWSDSRVRSGIGVSRENRRSPAVKTAPPMIAIEMATTSVAAQIGKVVASA